MIKKGIIALGLLAASTINAQDVQPYSPDTSEEGIVYYLPKTLLQVKITATRATYTPGEFCQYANRFLRLENISPNPEIHWDIKDIEVTPFGTPNPEQAYIIKLKDKSVASEVELTNDGIIKAINTTSPETPSKPQPVPVKKERSDPRKFMTEEMLMAGSSSKMAELVAKEIYAIRESKNSLTRGQADYMPKDGNALQIMLDNLNTQEKALTEMFTGHTESTDQSYTFTIEPDTLIQNDIVCRFSTKLGVLKINDLAGYPVYLSVIPTEKPEASVEAEGEAKKQPNGVIYNIPGEALVTIQANNKTYYKKELKFAQFGETEVLVNSLFNKKVNTRVLFDSTTGAIVKIDKD